MPFGRAIYGWNVPFSRAISSGCCRLPLFAFPAMLFTVFFGLPFSPFSCKKVGAWFYGLEPLEI